MACSAELPSWLRLLDAEDMAFIKRFVLASGSLKELGAVYGVSYPTIRLRLDRLIQKIGLAESAEVAGPFELALRASLADGKIAPETFKALRAAYWAEKERGDDREPNDGGKP